MGRFIFLFALLFWVTLMEVKGQKVDAPLEFDMSNPGMFAGTDFGRFFQRLYINQDYDRMLNYTSRQSREKYGDMQLLDYYRSMDFAFPLRLKSKAIQGDTIWLNYVTTIGATRTVVRMPVVVEHDTVRIIILSVEMKSFLRD